MGGDTAQSLMTDAFSDLGMTQTKLHLLQAECFSSGSLSQDKFGDLFVLQTIHQNDWSE